MFKYLLAWFAMMGAVMINGIVRDMTYGKLHHGLMANGLYCLSSIVLLGMVMYLFVRHWKLNTEPQALYIGSFWMMLTMAFKFLYSHYVGSHSWEELLANYDIAHGNLWPLVLLWVLIAPYLFYRHLDLKKISDAKNS